MTIKHFSFAFILILAFVVLGFITETASTNSEITGNYAEEEKNEK